MSRDCVVYLFLAGLLLGFAIANAQYRTDWPVWWIFVEVMEIGGGLEALAVGMYAYIWGVP